MMEIRHTTFFSTLIQEMNTISQFEKIKQISNATESECACEKCQSMCKHTPCIGTPNDINKIADAGFVQGYLARTTWIAGLPVGIPPIEMVQPRFIDGHGCAFLKNDGKCMLHDLNLKPTEGRLATCNTNNIKKLNTNLGYVVALTWVEK